MHIELLCAKKGFSEYSVGMDLQKCFKLAQDAGVKYQELASMYEAAITVDSGKLSTLIESNSYVVRFATAINPLTSISIADLESNTLLQFAAIFNPTTSTEVLDFIGQNGNALNFVIPEIGRTHRNASKELQSLWAVTESRLEIEHCDPNDYENEKYFFEAIAGVSLNSDFDFDIDALEGLLYLHLLGKIEAPDETGEFWADVYEYFEANPGKSTDVLSLFARMPALPENFVDCGAINRVRTIAAEMTDQVSEMETLLWDRNTLHTGIGGFYWLDSHSPRAAVAWNRHAPADLLIRIFIEESNNEKALADYPVAVLWRLAANPNSPLEVLEGIVSLLESGAIGDDSGYSQCGLLVGESDDSEGLALNPSIQGPLRSRVEKLMKDWDLEPVDFN